MRKQSKTHLAMILQIIITTEHAVAQLLEALRYKQEGRGFDSL